MLVAVTAEILYLDLLSKLPIDTGVGAMVPAHPPPGDYGARFPVVICKVVLPGLGILVTAEGPNVLRQLHTRFAARSYCARQEQLDVGGELERAQALLVANTEPSRLVPPASRKSTSSVAFVRAATSGFGGFCRCPFESLRWLAICSPCTCAMFAEGLVWFWASPVCIHLDGHSRLRAFARRGVSVLHG